MWWSLERVDAFDDFFDDFWVFPKIRNPEKPHKHWLSGILSKARDGIRTRFKIAKYGVNKPYLSNQS